MLCSWSSLHIIGFVPNLCKIQQSHGVIVNYTAEWFAIDTCEEVSGKEMMSKIERHGPQARSMSTMNRGEKTCLHAWSATKSAQYSEPGRKFQWFYGHSWYHDEWTMKLFYYWLTLWKCQNLFVAVPKKIVNARANLDSVISSSSHSNQ